MPGKIVTCASTGEETNSIVIKGSKTVNNLVKVGDMN